MSSCISHGGLRLQSDRSVKQWLPKRNRWGAWLDTPLTRADLDSPRLDSGGYHIKIGNREYLL